MPQILRRTLPAWCVLAISLCGTAVSWYFTHSSRGVKTRAGGTAAREAALAMLDRRRRPRRITLAGDKAYDVRAFVEELRARRVTPHITIDGNVRVTGRPRSTVIDKRTTRHPGYAVSQRIRKRIEEGFGWIKTTGNLAKTRHRGHQRVGWAFTLTTAACNLVRLPRLMPTG